MFKKAIKAIGFLCCCGILMLSTPETARAEEYQIEGIGATTSTTLVVKIDVQSVKIHMGESEDSAVIGTAHRGNTYEVIGVCENGWVNINNGSRSGYIPVKGYATIFEKTRENVDENLKLRQEVVNYALSFVGGRYVYGGNDPHTGVDCSGFTKYVMQHAAGVTLNRSSSSQAVQGKTITRDEIQPGDLIFYGGKGYINHVALYIGDQKIVHASTEKTGIKISRWDHRPQVKIINVLGD
ncbi:MAG: NlpC/P60 family protein [Lachnospiraceae bacterium]